MVILRSRNGCKNSGKIWWMVKFHFEGGSHASSSHEVSIEPTAKRREDLGKHNVHFPKDRNCEICKRTKITRAPCRRRNGEAVPRAVNFGDLITADHKVLSESCESRNNHRHAIVVQDLATQWIQAYPCKNKTSQETQKLAKVPGRGNQKSFTLTIPWNSAKLVKISPGIIARLLHTDRRPMVLRKEQCAERRKAPLLFCCNRVKRKLVGRFYGMLHLSAKRHRSII